LIEINMPLPAAGKQPGGMSNIVFRCPRTGLNVQHWMAEEAAPDGPQCTYETVICKACTRLHFINRSTGKLLGDDARRP
jgi:hypothetical protein